MPMRSKLCLVFWLASVCLPAWCANKAEKVTFQFAEKTRSFYLYAPKGAEPRPLVILLHGSGRNGRVMTDMWEEIAAKEGLVLAAPDALRPEAWDVATDGPAFMKQLIAEVTLRREVDTSRVYLFGHSAGAEFAILLGLLESQYFAAVAIHAEDCSQRMRPFLSTPGGRSQSASGPETATCWSPWTT